MFVTISSISVLLNGSDSSDMQSAFLLLDFWSFLVIFTLIQPTDKEKWAQQTQSHCTQKRSLPRRVDQSAKHMILQWPVCTDFNMWYYRPETGSTWPPLYIHSLHITNVHRSSITPKNILVTEIITKTYETYLPIIMPFRHVLHPKITYFGSVACTQPLPDVTGIEII